LSSFSGWTRTSLIVVALALLLAGAADARTTTKVVGTGGVYPNSGQKLLYAQATANNAKSLSAKLIVKPAQTLTLDWTVSCSNGVAVGANVAPGTKQLSGKKTVKSSAVTLMPLPIAHAKQCSASVYAYMTKKVNATAKIQIVQG
jgi:hypothetical protein